MKMAIQPISRTDYVSHVSFGDKHKKGCKPDGGQHMTPAVKAIPVVVLMAMSTLTQGATAENYNKQTASSPTTEVVVQNPQEQPKARGILRQYATSGHSSFLLWGVSRDDNPNDAETFLFKYRNKIEDNKVALLGGQFLAISDTPREEDGRYLMMYSPIDESGHVNGNYEIAYVPKSFANIMEFAAGGGADRANNKACGVAPFQDFVESFGEDAVKNAPNIEDATNKILNKKD